MLIYMYMYVTSHKLYHPENKQVYTKSVNSEYAIPFGKLHVTFGAILTK